MAQGGEVIPSNLDDRRASPPMVYRGSEPLTAKQAEVLDFITDFFAEHCAMSTMREVALGLGVTGLNGVNDHLRALSRKGYILWGGRAARGLLVLRLSDGTPVRAVLLPMAEFADRAVGR